jgi:hypothetical protein
VKQVIRTLAAACAFAALAGAQSAQPPRPAKHRISGVVVNGAGGAPLSRVRIVMNPVDGSRKETETTTGADGRFVFEGLLAGMWSLFAERKGYPRQGYCERPGVPNSLTQVVTGPDGASEGLTFRLYAPAVVTGKIIDETGEPVLAALEIIVQLETGRRQYQRIRNAATDVEGEYRIWDLPAVPCYLLAIAPMPEPTAPDQAPATFAPTYYSNTTDPRAATLLDLKPGEEYKADFILRRSRGVSIHIAGESGSSIMALSAEGPRGAEVILAQLDLLAGRTFYNIAAGRYTLTSFDGQTGAQSSRSIEVGAGDLTVQVPFPNPSSVTAKVRLVDGDPKLLNGATFLLHADGAYQTHARALGPDGTLAIPGMSAGRYKFMLAPGGIYVKSVTSANARVVDGIVDVPETGEVKLDVVLAGDGGRVAGKVRANGKPVAPARVVLAPRVDSTNSVDYPSYQTESDGSFEFTAVKPGDYILFVTTDWKLEFGNPAAIRKYLAAGRPIHVEPKGSIDLQLEPTTF